MEELFDSVLYLGPSSTITMSRLPVSLGADAQWIDMRLRRLALVPDFDGGQGLKRYCTTNAK
jgi:hypothetical protein